MRKHLMHLQLHPGRVRCGLAVNARYDLKVLLMQWAAVLIKFSGDERAAAEVIALAGALPKRDEPGVLLGRRRGAADDPRCHGRELARSDARGGVGKSKHGRRPTKEGLCAAT